MKLLKISNRKGHFGVVACLAATAVLVPVMSFAADETDAEIDNPKQPGDASVRPETDDATARRRYMEAWYESPFTTDYKKWLNEAAARERETNAALLPPPPTEAGAAASSTGATAETLAATKTWNNLGPTKADYIKNGIVLQKTDSGRPVAIVTHPTNADIVYLATSGGGVWKTTNATSATQPTWTPLTESLGSLACGALAMDPTNPSTLYLGLGDAFDGTGIGLTKTTDGGAHWAPIVYLGDSTIITDIHVAQDKPNIVLVTTDRGLFRSNDSGGSFSLVTLPNVPSVPYCWSIAWGGGTNYVVSAETDQNAPTDKGWVFHSADDGATWKKATGPAKASGIGRITVASSPLNRKVMYAEAAIPNSTATKDLADFFRSTDGGHSWSPMKATAAGVVYKNQNQESKAPQALLNGQGWYNQLVIPSNLNTNTVYFGGALLLARATNAGALKPVYTQMTNWLAQFGLPYVHADFHAGAYDSAGNLYVGTDGGLFRSGDNGMTWTDKLNVGIVSHLVYSIGSSEAAPSVVLGGLQDNGTRLRSGTTSTFNQQLGGDGFGSHVHPQTPSMMLGSLYYDRVFKSTDGGSSFSPASSGITESNDPNSAPFITHLTPWLGGGNTVFTHSYYRVYKTTNYASSWSALGTTGLLNGSGSLRNVGVAKSNDNVVGAVASGGRVFLSKNGGASWQQAADLPQNAYSTSCVAFDPTKPNTVYVASVAPVASAAHLWKSTDFGAHWAILDSHAGFPTGVPVNVVIADPQTPTTLYAGTHLGVYRSTNSGGSWSRFGAGMPLVNITDLYVSAKRVRAATFGRGFWEFLK